MIKPLNPKQELFCQYFVTGTDTFGNGVKSYAEAYDFELTDGGGYQTAKANANRLLNSPIVKARIAEMLEQFKIKPEEVDNQLAFLIRQNANLALKLQAINTYYRFRPISVPNEGRVDLGERAAMLARKYMDPQEWNSRYGHYLTEAKK